MGTRGSDECNPGTSNGPPGTRPPAVTVTTPDTTPLRAPAGPKSTDKLQGGPYVTAPSDTGAPPATDPDEIHNEQVYPEVGSTYSDPYNTVNEPVDHDTTHGMSDDNELANPDTDSGRVTDGGDELGPVGGTQNLADIIVNQSHQSGGHQATFSTPQTAITPDHPPAVSNRIPSHTRP